jgi:hypothetical protein
LGSYGGGMFSAACNPKLTNCKFTGNSAVNGGGMFNGQSGPTLTNCIFSGNSTDSEGGGMYNYDDSSPALTNCTFAANSALNGSALACDSYQQRLPSSPQVTNCVLWDGGNEIWNNDNSAITITYSNVQSPPSTESGEGNINADPCFTEPGYWVDKNDPNIIVEPNDPNAVWVDGDYHLWEGSPCINAGDPNYVDDPNETDLAGQPRIIGGRIDMGAFEAVIQTKANLCVLPRVINRRSRQPEIMALIRLPEGITRDQIDDNQPLLLYPGGIEAHLWRTQYFIPSGKAAQRSARILALFDKAELMAAVEDNSEVELQLVGRLRTGWYFYGIDIVEIIDRKDNDGGDG